VAGLFAGVGGIELGLGRAGFHTCMLCECLPEALAVLTHRFPTASIETDIRLLAATSHKRLPDVDVLTAGFPCQDLSQCGRRVGILGQNSGLIDCVLELLSRRKRGPRWLIIENVPFMLRLDGGRAMTHLTQSLETLGFAWAYRVVDARAFGLPQRRERVILMASRQEDPRSILLAEDVGERVPIEVDDDRPRGFYWTEGNRGLGWAFDSIPTLKAGSTLGIPSPPAIWLPAFDELVTPTIEDAEAMQGLPRHWTSLTHCRPRLGERLRWRLVGNSVPPPIAEWIGRLLLAPGPFDASTGIAIRNGAAWPTAAWGAKGQRFAVEMSPWPIERRWCGLSARYGLRGEGLLARPRLSERAAYGFYQRLSRSSLRQSKDDRFMSSLRRFIRVVRTTA
jgi:DNA (cytosine-5)-methyltransferase 1